MIVVHFCELILWCPFHDGKTALMLAARGGHTETAKILIDAGADVKLKRGMVRIPVSLILLQHDV